MRDPRTYISHLFSRGVLGSILVGVAAGKVVEKLVILLFPTSTSGQLIGWVVTFVAFVWLYVYWADIESFVEDQAVDSND